jgi:uncharacterized protein
VKRVIGEVSRGRPFRSISVALSLEQGGCLVSIARKAIDSVVIDKRVPTFSDVSASMTLSDETRHILMAERGAFVTLRTAEGRLRGCIGIPYPVEPLADALVQAAVGASLSDPRFPKVEASELDSLTVEISALTMPEVITGRTLDRPASVRVGIDGLIASGQGRSGLLLPQVATEMGLTSETFLSLTCEKAGLPPDAWLAPSVEVRRFQAEVFVEATPRGVVEGAHTAS